MAEMEELMHQLPGNFADLAVNSTEAISLNLTHPGTGKKCFADFPPSFTYAMFGEDETIVGYKDLSIRIDFRAHDLKPSVSIKYAQKMKPINDQMAELMDIEGKLKEYLPEGAFDAAEGARNGAANGSAKEWRPPGELAHGYTNEGRKFEIWRSSLTDPQALEILANMRILVPLFIEGGTIGFLNEPDWSLERWKLFLLYEVDAKQSGANAYTLAGFSTSYRLWVFPSGDVSRMASLSSPSSSKLRSITSPDFDPEQTSMPTAISPLDLLSRERISQFIILPPFQSSSHGSRLYNAMVSLFRSDPLCFEITVEEPNEQFDVLRDMNDMAHLLSQSPDNEFGALTLPASISQADLRRPSWIPDMVDSSTIFSLRAKAKLAPRQFIRLLEIHLFSTLPKANRNPNAIRITRKANSADENDRKYYFWRLMVKERLFIRNKDQLIQLDEKDRIPKLEEILPGVIDEYEERIAQFERRKDVGLVRIVEDFCGKAQKSAIPKKRKVIEEDDDEESSGGEVKKVKGLGSAKKAVGKGRRVVLETSDIEDEQYTLHE